MLSSKNSNKKKGNEKEDEVQHAASSTADPLLSLDNKKSKISTPLDTSNETQQQDEIAQLKLDLEKEKARKRKLYSSLIKIADELKQTKEDNAAFVEAAEYANRPWYNGGLWRSPQLLPDVLRGNNNNQAPEAGVGNFGTIIREPVSLTDLFLDLVCVTAFSRVGDAVQSRGGVNGPILAYFALFWLIWMKEASYATRFDTTDLSSQMETLLTCFAVLYGSLSVTDEFGNSSATRLMMVGGFVSLLHFFLHWRVAYLYREAAFDTQGYHAKKYAVFIMVMTFLEFVTWMVGALTVPEGHPWRWLVFLAGICLSMRVPKAFLANDFHAASSKRGVLFIILLGYTLQSIVLVAAPFFDSYMSPSSNQYNFLGAICFILFCIKLLYVDDTYSIDPRDHALLVNRFAGFFFHTGQFLLLVSTTVLWAGLDLLSRTFYAGAGALPNNAKSLVSGGYAAVIFSILFIKSMHIRRIPLNPSHEKIFYATYGLQLLIYLVIIFFSLSLCLGISPHLTFILAQPDAIIYVLAGSSMFLVMVSWLDEAIEATLYGNHDSVEEHRVQPFGFWTCLLPKDEFQDVRDLHDNSLLSGPGMSRYSSMGVSNILLDLEAH